MKAAIKLLMSLQLIASGAALAGPSPLSPTLYYEIGGGTSYQRPLNESTLAPDIGISAKLNLPLSCDIWDTKILELDAYPRLIEEYVRGELDRLGQAVVLQLSQLGQGLAVAALQRALPGIYDYSQTLTAQINARVDIAKRSCEDVVNDIDQGVNPLDPWKRIGVAVGWRSSLLEDPGAGTVNPDGSTAGPTSILAAQRSVAQNGTSEPIPWFGDDPAGSAENPIYVVEDLVKAGYNVFQSASGAPVDLSAETTAEGQSVDIETLRGTEQLPTRLGLLFADTGEAIEWANRFIGEQEIYTCTDPGCESSYRPGLGLAVMVNEEAEALTGLWDALMTAEVLPSIEQLTEVSSETVQMTTFEFEALLRFPLQDQDVYIGRFISDVALSRTVEKAMAIRRMILVSSESPVVRGYVQAGKVSNEITNRIKLEIDDLMWAVQTQHKLSSTVSKSIMAYDALRDSNVPVNIGGGLPVGRTSTFVSDRPEAPSVND